MKHKVIVIVATLAIMVPFITSAFVRVPSGDKILIGVPITTTVTATEWNIRCGGNTGFSGWKNDEGIDFTVSGGSPSVNTDYVFNLPIGNYVGYFIDCPPSGQTPFFFEGSDDINATPVLTIFKTLFTVPTSTVDSLTATITDAFADPGLLLVIVLAAGLPLAFCAIRRVIGLIPKGR